VVGVYPHRCDTSAPPLRSPANPALALPGATVTDPPTICTRGSRKPTLVRIALPPLRPEALAGVVSANIICRLDPLTNSKLALAVWPVPATL
jgi:hypothetical protein